MLRRLNAMGEMGIRSPHRGKGSFKLISENATTGAGVRLRFWLSHRWSLGS